MKMLIIIHYVCNRIIESEETCPMCSERVNPEIVSSVSDIHPYLDYQEERKA